MLKQNNTRFTKAQLGQAVRTARDGNDDVRVNQLTRLHKLKSAKQTARKKEYRRLMMKHDGDYAPAQKRAQWLRDQSVELKTLQMEINRASTPVPALDAGTWLIHGYVYDSVGDPVPNADIQLLLADGRERPEFGSARTDAKGYYRLLYQTAGGTYSGGDAQTGTGETGTGSTNAQSGGLHINSNLSRLRSGMRVNATSQILFARASDPGNADVYGDSSFIQPHVGVPNYRDIIIPTSKTFDHAEVNDIRTQVMNIKQTSGGMLKRGKK